MKRLTMVMALLVASAFAFSGSWSWAAPAAPQVQKVGGNYIVKSVEKVDGRGFVITFESKVKTGKFDRLVLESDHVHFAVKEGDTLRLSAEVLAVNGAEAQVSQVLLFLPHVQGYTPVWILSKHRSDDLNGSRYIEMHAPQSDYQIF